MFSDEIKTLCERFVRTRGNAQTEEATKMGMVAPFLNALGWNVFNIDEVIPEYSCDFGVKKSEKIDYAICKDGRPFLLIECKQCDKNLDKHDGQLFRYFAVSKARFGLLTNGIEYRFFADTEKPNIMDETPFFTFRADAANDKAIDGLSRFTKETFNEEIVIQWATQLKSSTSVKAVLEREFATPSADFIRFIGKQIGVTGIKEKQLPEYQIIIKRAFNAIVTDAITTRLNIAADQIGDITATGQCSSDATEPAEEDSDKPKIITTQEELEGFYLVRSILRPYVSPARIYYRDTQSYFGILLDDSSWKTICRLHLNRQKKYIGIIGENKNETRFEIKSLDDIYKYEQEIAKTIAMYESAKAEKTAAKEQEETNEDNTAE